MADQIEVTSLAAQAASSIDSDTQVVAFTQSGDTTRLPFMQAVAESNSQNGCICVKEASLTIASADVLTLNTTPLEIVAATGAGTAIQVIAASLSMTYNSTQYLTNQNIQLITTGAVEGHVLGTIGQTFSTIAMFEPETGTGGVVQLVDNASLLVKVPTGDPTAGDSDITIYVTYRIITL